MHIAYVHHWVSDYLSLLTMHYIQTEHHVHIFLDTVRIVLQMKKDNHGELIPEYNMHTYIHTFQLLLSCVKIRSSSLVCIRVCKNFSYYILPGIGILFQKLFSSSVRKNGFKVFRSQLHESQFFQYSDEERRFRESIRAI